MVCICLHCSLHMFALRSFSNSFQVRLAHWGWHQWKQRRQLRGNQRLLRLLRSYHHFISAADFGWQVCICISPWISLDSEGFEVAVSKEVSWDFTEVQRDYNDSFNDSISCARLTLLADHRRFRLGHGNLVIHSARVQCPAMFHDVLWCSMMFHDVQWCSMYILLS